MMSKTTLNSGFVVSKSCSNLGGTIEPNNSASIDCSEEFSPISDLLTPISKEDLNFDSRTLSRLANSVEKSSKRIYSKNKIRVDQFEEYHIIYNKQYEFQEKILRDKQFSKILSLFSLVAPLERKTRNNYLKTLESQNFLFSEAKVRLKASYKFQLEKGNNPQKKDYEPTLKNIKNIFFHIDKDKRRKLDKLLEKEVILKNSLEQAEFNLSLFYDYGFIKYFTKTINHLETALGTKLSFKCKLTSYEHSKIDYFCRDKFCLVSKKRKVEQTKALLIPALRKLKDFEGFRTSFFTISPKNVDKKYFNNAVFKNFGAVIFRIFNHRLSLSAARNFDYNFYEQRLISAFKSHKFDDDPIKNEEKFLSNLRELKTLTPKFLSERPMLKDYFKGYYGVPEVVEKETEVNMHYHCVVVRDSDFESGFVSKFYIEELIKECFTKWGCSVLKGSSISDIRSKTKAGKDDIDSVLDYLLVDYFLKGVKIQTKSFWKDFIVASEGIRFERSGGLLAKNKLIETAINYNCEKSVYYGLNGLYDSSHSYIEFGGKKNLKGESIKSPLHIPFRTLRTLKSFYAVDDIHLRLLYTASGQKTSFYHLLKESMFGKNPFLCPFSSEPLKLDSFREDEFETSIGDPAFIYSSLIAIAKKHEDSNLTFIAESFLEKIYPSEFSQIDDEYFHYVESNLHSVTQ